MRRIFVLAAALLAWTGCIEFEKQTMSFRHFPEADTLVVWQQYEGIYGGSGRDELNQEELDQLRSVRTTQRTFFFNNWISEYDEKQLADWIRQMQQELEKQKPGHDPALQRQAIELAQLIRKSVTVKNGPFYLNAQGKLSATQEVAIRNAGKIIKLTNHVIRQTITEQMARDELDGEDEKYLHLLEQSIEKQTEYITLKNGRLVFRWPQTAAQFKALPQEAELAKVIAQFEQAGGTLVHAKDEVTVSLGKPKAAGASLAVVLPGNTYRANAVKQVDRIHGIKRAYNAKTARKDFFKRMAKRYKK